MKRSKVVVCDSSPLIFLAKMDCLDLIPQIMNREIHVLSDVVSELFAKTTHSGEFSRLKSFLEGTRIVDYTDEKSHPSKLSSVDFASLAYALKIKAEILLVDERLLRRAAIENKIRVMGCLGILLTAHDQGLKSKQWTKNKIEQAMTIHGLRIAVSLYGQILKRLD